MDREKVPLKERKFKRSDNVIPDYDYLFEEKQTKKGKRKKVLSFLIMMQEYLYWRVFLREETEDFARLYMMYIKKVPYLMLGQSILICHVMKRHLLKIILM